VIVLRINETATAEGVPSTRHVLLKELDSEGFVFFTNHGSRKAAEILQNPHVSLCFPWFAMERQVVACGEATAITREESRAYWVTRPRDSQIGAWASAQSSVIASRAELEASAAEAAERFPDDVPLPEFWGGFRVVPSIMEFWQGGPGRLHDRLRYRRADGDWTIERLAP
jgi:pyridoxamine 5'-phosphate oxidase